jgi:flagellar basal-body rod modification protein FlgD
MSSPVTGATQSPAAQSTGASANPLASLTGATDPLANEETFLQLLVSQLQNQDPMNPTDSNQFVSQLTSYSQLEQLINIHKDADSLVSNLTGATGASASTTSTTSDPTTNTGN